jgi:hypothetical protein
MAKAIDKAIDKPADAVPPPAFASKRAPHDTAAVENRTAGTKLSVFLPCGASFAKMLAIMPPARGAGRNPRGTFAPTAGP